MGALKYKKENKKMFLSSNITQMEGETCGISRKHIFNIINEKAQEGGLKLY